MKKKKKRGKAIKELIQNIELLNPSDFTDIINQTMANTKKQLSYNELALQVSSLTLPDKLTLLQDLKTDIDNKQSELTGQLDHIKAVKSKINGEGK